MSASAFVNKHITRVMNDSGVSPVTIDSAAWLLAVDAWLTANDCHKYLLHWVNPAFGHKLSSGHITKIYDIGTTRLPRGGDYTPTTTGATYSATGMNSTVPGWTNANFSDHAYFGSGRLNQIRRKIQITMVAAYKKPDTNTGTFLSIGEAGGIGLQHTSGSPGSASFYVEDATHIVTATKAAGSATTANIIAGVFDGTNVIAYVEAVAGTSQTGLAANTDLAATHSLRGSRSTTTTVPTLISGADSSKYLLGTEAFSFANNQGKWSASDLIVFESGLSGALISSLTTLLRTRIGA